MYDSVLFDTAPWVILVSIFTGIVLGIFRSKAIQNKIIGDGRVIRHNGSGFFQHWGTALGIFALIASGIIMGFLFFPTIIKSPSGFIFPMNMHFVGLIVTLFGGFYFLTSYLLSKKIGTLIPDSKDIIHGTFGKYILRKTWTPEDKYLSSQKASFLLFAILGLGQLVTGGIKVAAHIWSLSPSLMSISTVLHDIFSLLFILLLLEHILFVVLIKKHRILLASWFKGTVAEEYTRKEHTFWYSELQKQQLEVADSEEINK
ncbi:MAG: cytochrome b/b6 domain-containing protein [Dehalococcoidales bacterium]|nr:cytochrome b/b6 domain-containing protein [Dehalococcoidales bacterium]